jgi:hypothetical protein
LAIQTVSKFINLKNETRLPDKMKDSDWAEITDTECFSDRCSQIYSLYHVIFIHIDNECTMFQITVQVIYEN